MGILSASLELSPREVDYWTNGDKLTGDVVLHCKDGEEAQVQLVQVSLVCEEWVHTGSLEFKEHCRQIERVWPASRSSSERLIVKSKELKLPLDVLIPAQKSPKKYPPSFSLRYNSIAWCLKAVVVYTKAGSSEIYTAEFDKPFRLCTRTEKKHEEALLTPSVEQLALDEYSYSVRKKDFKAVQVEMANGSNSNNENSGNTQNVSKIARIIPAKSRPLAGELDDVSLQLRLRIPQSGLLQKPGQFIPIYLDAHLAGCKRLEIFELDFSIIESADTYYKDPLISRRKVKCQNAIVLHEGDNKLDTRLDADKLLGLTEDFKSEWQNITHVLKLLFVCQILPDTDYFTLTWEVPTRVLSEAETITYID